MCAVADVFTLHCLFCIFICLFALMSRPLSDPDSVGSVTGVKIHTLSPSEKLRAWRCRLGNTLHVSDGPEIKWWRLFFFFVVFIQICKTPHMYFNLFHVIYVIYCLKGNTTPVKTAFLMTQHFANAHHQKNKKHPIKKRCHHWCNALLCMFKALLWFLPVSSLLHCNILSCWQIKVFQAISHTYSTLLFTL